MKRKLPDDAFNERLRRDLKHYVLLCAFGLACAFAFMKNDMLPVAAYCAFIPACMIMIYLFSAPACNHKGNNILLRFMVTAYCSIIIGGSICLFVGPQIPDLELTWKQFVSYCALSAVIFFLGIKSGIFPLPPKKK